MEHFCSQQWHSDGAAPTQPQSWAGRARAYLYLYPLITRREDRPHRPKRFDFKYLAKPLVVCSRPPASAEIMLAQRLAGDPDSPRDPGVNPAERQQEPDFTVEITDHAKKIPQ